MIGMAVLLLALLFFAFLGWAIVHVGSRFDDELGIGDE